MALQLTQEQVLALAPDASSASAGRKLAAPKTWQSLGTSERVVWGECQGSALYQTQVSITDLSTKCSCPSRKFPCKHALGLLLMAVSPGGAVKESPEPEWVTAWLSKREAASTKSAAKKAGEAKPVDAEAQAKRASQRNDRVLKGLEQLDAWLEDLVRQGLGRVESEPPSFWEQQAKRLVDAQAPGLAARVRRLAELPRSGADGARQLLARLGQLALASQAFRRVEELDPLVRQDLRQLIGFTVEQDLVAAEGEKLADDWIVVGQTVEDDERVRVQRTWLMGAESGRPALVLQFAVGPERFALPLALGTQQRCELAFWPSAAPLRALITKREGTPAATDHLVAARSIPETLAAWAERLAKSPWTDLVPAVLAQVTPVAGPNRRVLLREATGAALPLSHGSHDRLFAISGGHPLDLAGEWDGEHFRPLSTVSDGRFVSLLGASHA